MSDKNSITFVAAGDFGPLPFRERPEDVFDLTRSIFKSADIAFLQLEKNLTDRGTVQLNVPRSIARTRPIAAKAMDCSVNDIFLASTGVIGEPLDATKFDGVLATLAQSAQPGGWLDAAKAIMTAFRTMQGEEVHTSTPAPPFRGALPSAQPVASASIVPETPLAPAAHHLLADTDAAIARHTLLQIASLPDRIDALPQPAPNDPTGPRWNFEIPFATPQGTAMAQFEISRDGGGSEAEAAKKVWRARFTLDVEPTGPVHALIALVGEKTSVRMWAERPQTAARLRAGAFELSQALSRAELVPGDIVIREGTPPQPAPPNSTGERPADPNPPSDHDWTPAHTNRTPPTTHLRAHPGIPAPNLNSPEPPAPATCPPETSDTPSADAHPATAPNPSGSPHQTTH